MKIKTIDIKAFEWFDKVNGNSYFAGTITVNYAMETEKTFTMPYQYGYGTHFQCVAFKLLRKNGIIKDTDNRTSLWQYCENNGIILRTQKIENCKKSQLKNI